MDYKNTNRFTGIHGAAMMYRLPALTVNQPRSFPIDAIPDCIREAIIDVDRELGGGVELAASAALGVVSLVCQEFVNVERPKLRPSACSLFLITIAGTGAGKSEILGRFMAPLEEFEREEAKRVAAVAHAGNGHVDDEHQADMSRALKELPARERLDMLRKYRAKREQLVEEYDGINTRYVELRKQANAPRYETRRVDSARDNSIAQAKRDMELIKPQMDKLQRSLSSVEALLRALAGTEARRLVYGRGSFAGFRNGLQEKCRTAGIVSAEAGGILNSALVTRNMDAWNDLWGCEFYRETYDKREYVIESPRLTLSLMLQPKQFEKFMDAYGENALDNGFLSRTLLIKVPAQFPMLAGEDNDTAPDIPGLAAFHQRVAEILKQDFPWTEERAVLKLDANARRYWERYYNTLIIALEGGRFYPEMEGFVRKLPEQAVRIAALFHYFQHYPVANEYVLDNSPGLGRMANNEIPLETIAASVRLCDWYMKEFYSLVVSHRLPEPVSSWVYSTQVRANADRIFQTIKQTCRHYDAHRNGTCFRLSYRNIQNANRTIKSKAEIVAALHCLASEGLVRESRGPKGGLYVCYSPYGAYCYECDPVPRQHGVMLSANGFPPPAAPITPAAPSQPPGNAINTQAKETIPEERFDDLGGEYTSLLDVVASRFPAHFSGSAVPPVHDDPAAATSQMAAAVPDAEGEPGAESVGFSRSLDDDTESSRDTTNKDGERHTPAQPEDDGQE